MRKNQLRILLLILLIVILTTAFLQSHISHPFKQFLSKIFVGEKPLKPNLHINPEKLYCFVDAEHGDDRNDGSKEKPWKTLDKASLAKPKKKGTVILFRGGTYAGTLNPQSNGLKTAWLTYRAYPGEKVEINGLNSIGPGINLRGKCYIRIDGFDVTGFDGDGIAIDSKYGQHHLVVANCRIHHVAGSGIRIRYAQNIGIVKNLIYNTGEYGIADKDHSAHVLLSGNDISFPGIDCIYISSPHFTIDGNYLHDNSKPTNPNEHADGIQIFIDLDDYREKPFTTGIIIRNNTIKLNPGRCNKSIQSNSLMLENAGRLSIYNNVVIGLRASNVIDIKNCPGSGIFNNTFVDSRHQGIYIHENSTGCSVYNNLVYGSKGQSLLVAENSVAGLNSDYNIFSGPVKWKRSIMPLGRFADITGNDRHSILVTAKPGFVDYNGHNLKITEFSPAYNSGYPNNSGLIEYPACDIDGKQRCIGGLIDIGAYECAPAR
jgi:parallel beta-helix repeat protein